jgi:hypothetical protein
LIQKDENQETRDKMQDTKTKRQDARTKRQVTITRIIRRLINMCLERFLKSRKSVDARETLSDFETFSDLEAWFDLHKELRLEPPNMCDDYSRETRALAEADGFFMSCELVNQGKVYQTQLFFNADGSPDTAVYHIGNMAIVTDAGECWYVDLAFGKLIKLCNFIPGGKY